MCVQSTGKERFPVGPYDRLRGLTSPAAFARLATAAVQHPAGSYRAEVAELADAHGSGPCTRKGVGVRVPSSAPASLKLFFPDKGNGRPYPGPIGASVNPPISRSLDMSSVTWHSE